MASDVAAGVSRLPIAGRVTLDFDAELAARGLAALGRQSLTTLQINVGKLCNQACQHCHVEAGPKRTEVMNAAVADRILTLAANTSSIGVVDITGGAPELNPHFRSLVRAFRARDIEVIDRCNLTVLLEPGMDDLAQFLASQRVHVIASLPCYSQDNVDQQRGRGVFDASITALKQLNALGYGQNGSGLILDLVYNPVGAFLPPPQTALEAEYKIRLRGDAGIEFNRLLTITNLPISRFAHFLERTGQHAEYMRLLASSFNPATVASVMCRTMVSVGYDGKLYDCDFNQMLDMPLSTVQPNPSVLSIWDVDSFSDVVGQAIATGPHCFGCTAGAGSSCGGALR